MFPVAPFACRVSLDIFFLFDGKMENSRKLFSLGRFLETGKVKG